MADVVRLTEDVLRSYSMLVTVNNRFVVGISVGMVLSLEGVELGVGHNVGAGSVFYSVNLTGDTVGVGILHEEFLLGLAQQEVIPIADGVVLVVGLVVDDNLLALFELHTGS